VITWDEPKRAKNIESHGLDFAVLSPDFFVDAKIVPAKLGRFKAIGPFEETVIAVVFKPLGSEALAVISMRHASRKERREWES
jgi:uncharacterized DUF497 family protein